MDTTTITVMGMILNHSCLSFKLIILLNNTTNDISYLKYAQYLCLFNQTQS